MNINHDMGINGLSKVISGVEKRLQRQSSRNIHSSNSLMKISSMCQNDIINNLKLKFLRSCSKSFFNNRLSIFT